MHDFTASEIAAILTGRLCNHGISMPITRRYYECRGRAGSLQRDNGNAERFH